MRILQVVPLITPTNDYGGPITVALGQCAGLQAAGHEVVLAGGTWGYDVPPAAIDGVPVRLFPARSLLPGRALGGLTAPGLVPWLRRAVRGADVVHVHLARDLLTLPAARLLAAWGVPFVLQTHGMVVESAHPLAGVLDRVLTTPAMRAAGRVFFLTDAERDSLASLFPEARLQRLRNGIAPDTAAAVGPPERDDPIDAVDDNDSGDDPVEVLFLARVQARKRPLDFVAMARALAAEFPGASFRLVGPDEGMGAQVRAAIADAGLGPRLRWDGPVAPAQVGEIMAAADLYVLPSVDEPYPMTVLEALAHGVPVVVTDTCGLAPVVRTAGAGRVVPAGAAGVTEAVRALLTDPTRRAAAGRAAAELARTTLSLDAVVAELAAVYTEVGEGTSRS